MEFFFKTFERRGKLSVKSSSGGTFVSFEVLWYGMDQVIVCVMLYWSLFVTCSWIRLLCSLDIDDYKVMLAYLAIY